MFCVFAIGKDLSYTHFPPTALFFKALLSWHCSYILNNGILYLCSPLDMDPPKEEFKAGPIYHDGSVLEASQSEYDTDDAYLKSLGKSAELHRVYNFWTCDSPTISP
jgi:hypothetical protein